MNYFQAFNGTNVIINDTYRFLFYSSTLDLSQGAKRPSAVPYIRDSLATGWDVYLRILQFDKVGSWMYIQEPVFMSQSSCPRYMCFLKRVESNKLHGIKFKKPCTNPKIYVRLTYSALGNAILNNSSVCTVFVEVLSSDASADINSVGGYLDYFDIVEMANDKESIPLCSNGVEIRNQNNEIIWNSNCKMVDIVATYNSATAGEYRFSNFSKNHILIPTKSHKSAKAWDGKGDDWCNTAQYRDFFTFDGNNLISFLATIKGYGGNEYGRDAGMWDIRDFGSDPNKYISGMIAKT